MSSFQPVMWECMWERRIEDGDVVYFTNGEKHPHQYLHRVCIENRPPLYFVQAQVYQNEAAKSTDGWFNVSQHTNRDEALDMAKSLVQALEGKASEGLVAPKAPLFVYVLLINQVEVEDDSDASSEDPEADEKPKDKMFVFESKENAIDMAMKIIWRDEYSSNLNHVQQSVVKRELITKGRVFVDGGKKLYQILERPLLYNSDESEDLGLLVEPVD